MEVDHMSLYASDKRITTQTSDFDSTFAEKRQSGMCHILKHKHASIQPGAEACF